MRIRLDISGRVQGVGFRPFVFRLASGMGIGGWVRNTPFGVSVEAEADSILLEEFAARLAAELPPHAAITCMSRRLLPDSGSTSFEILPSVAGVPGAMVMPDLAVCGDCLADVLDPANRRYRYPFTNCTNCGPRYSIMLGLPYDRDRTTMRRFSMCPECAAEFSDPSDRRFHAQPNACPACGPALTLLDPSGSVKAVRDEAMASAVAALRSGRIVAVKGLGGFHLFADARAEDAVTTLRRTKRRPSRPFAVMVPSMESARKLCVISDQEAALMESAAAPIVLLERKGGDGLCEAVAPGNPYLGVMLPYTPLHRILMDDFGMPAVATSGNMADEPICTDEAAALSRLAGIADLFLVHDRPIARPVDDSVVCVSGERRLMIRRSRGYAPLPVAVPREGPSVLALGALGRNTIAAARRDCVFVSQHLGDMESAASLDVMEAAVGDMRILCGVEPDLVVSDMHPDYVTTRLASSFGKPVARVQHHHAHALSCMAENGLEGPVLAVAWDGTGYGADGTVWGGEFLKVEPGGAFVRFAGLRRFLVPGSLEEPVDPARVAAGFLHGMGVSIESAWPDPPLPREEIRVLAAMLEKGVNCAPSSSMGRLFDAVSSLLCLCRKATYEGEAAVALEHAMHGTVCTGKRYRIPITGAAGDGSLMLDWEPLLRAVLEDRNRGEAPGLVSLGFHETLIEAIVEVACLAGVQDVLLTGGCFQNRKLSAGAVGRLEEKGFRVHTHQEVPPGDGGVSLGQAYAVVLGCVALGGGGDGGCASEYQVR